MDVVIKVTSKVPQHAAYTIAHDREQLASPRSTRQRLRKVSHELPGRDGIVQAIPDDDELRVEPKTPVLQHQQLLMETVARHAEIEDLISDVRIITLQETLEDSRVQ